MTNVTFGFSSPETRPLMQADVQPELLEELCKPDAGFAGTLDYGKKAGTILETPTDDEVTSYVFDFSRAWEKRDRANKHQALHAAKEALTTIVNSTLADIDNSGIYARIGSQPVADGRISMLVEVKWPDVPDAELTNLVTYIMRSTAKDLRYPDPDNPRSSERMLNDSVFAWLERENGGELQTNPIGSCSIGTDGAWYESSDPILELTAHNIYSREQQLICLSGAIAIANAGDLLQRMS